MVSDMNAIDAGLGAGESLNPCSNGIWSLTNGELKPPNRLSSLNPCSNGIWSLTCAERSRAIVRQ